MKNRRAGTMTHDYKRHDTTTLFAALDVLAGTVTGINMQRHRHQEFIHLLDRLERDTPTSDFVDLVLDNVSSHKTSEVRRWLARHPRWTFYFSPTSSSWLNAQRSTLNAVEGFFAKLTRRRLKHGVFRSICDLQAAINRLVAGHNEDEERPFVWRADPDAIISAHSRGFQTLETIH